MRLSRLQRIGSIAALAGLAGCTYAAADQAQVFEMNTCTLPSDCLDGAECRDGMCVAQQADALTIMLRVTPLRTPDVVSDMPNVSGPMAILLARIQVDGPMERTFPLQVPVEVSGIVRRENVPVEAEISFTPVSGVSGLSLTPVSAMVSVASLQADVDYAVELVPGLEYRMLVQPRDIGLPPFRRTFVAEEGQQINVDYAPLMSEHVQTLTINADYDRRLLVRAFSLDSAELISSTAIVEEGAAVLHFASEPPPYRLEFRAEQSYDPEQPMPPPGQALCDSETPVFPVFTVDASELEPADDGSLVVTLPTQPQRIRFEGTVDLCEEADAGALSSMMITLNTRSLVLMPEDTPVAGTFEATTSATLDQSNLTLHFCVQVMPGQYDLVASPPVSMPCSLFAERRLIQSPDGMASTGPALALPDASYLVGTLKTGLTPLRGAVVDAVALGRSLELDVTGSGSSPPQMATGGVPLTRYNRSAGETSDSRGYFKVPVDVGSYDVLIKPPSGSGFSWQVRRDVTIGTRSGPYPTEISLLSPVTVKGTLNFEAARRGGECDARFECDLDATLEGAQIDAFAIVDDEASDGERAIAIGTTTANKDGGFTLLVPPSIRHGW